MLFVTKGPLVFKHELLGKEGFTSLIQGLLVHGDIAFVFPEHLSELCSKKKEISYVILLDQFPIRVLLAIPFFPPLYFIYP